MMPMPPRRYRAATAAADNDLYYNTLKMPTSAPTTNRARRFASTALMAWPYDGVDESAKIGPIEMKHDAPPIYAVNIADANYLAHAATELAVTCH